MIGITGLSGYIGIHLANFLKENKKDFIGLIKKNTADRDIEVLTDCRAPYCLVDFLDAESVYNALDGVTTIVHLVGSIYKPKNMSLHTLHADVTTTLLEAAKKRGVKKIIYISALGSSLEAASSYHKTKAEAESAIKQSGIPYVILEPSLIFGKLYGHRNSKIVARMADSITRLPFIPVVGSGKNKLQPLYIMDLVECIYASIDPSIKKATIELGGPQVMTMEEIASTIAGAAGCAEKNIVRLPLPLASVLAALMEKFSEQPKITRDQVKMAGKDNICSTPVKTPFKELITTSMTDALTSLL
ncbi:MAG: NAD-dependent epimerase/dehydratase family protein [Candidatus Auribacterota bacterium]